MFQHTARAQRVTVKYELHSTLSNQWDVLRVEQYLNTRDMHLLLNVVQKSVNCLSLNIKDGTSSVYKAIPPSPSESLSFYICWVNNHLFLAYHQENYLSISIFYIVTIQDSIDICGLY